MEALETEMFQYIDAEYAQLNANFADRYTEIMEAYENSYMTEASLVQREASVGEALRIFMAGIVNTIQKIKDSIVTEIQQRLFAKEYKEKIAQLKEKIQAAHDEGATTVEMPDYKVAVRIYENMVTDLSNKAQKISEPSSYLTTKGLDNDIDEFMDIAAKYEEEFEKVMNKPVKVKTLDALAFIESESKNGHILDSLDKAMRTFRQMESNVKQIEKKEEIVGRELITKRVVIIRKSSNQLIKSIRKFVAKLVGRIVFYFA